MYKAPCAKHLWTTEVLKCDHYLKEGRDKLKMPGTDCEHTNTTELIECKLRDLGLRVTFYYYYLSIIGVFMHVHMCASRAWYRTQEAWSKDNCQESVLSYHEFQESHSQSIRLCGKCLYPLRNFTIQSSKNFQVSTTTSSLFFVAFFFILVQYIIDQYINSWLWVFLNGVLSQKKNDLKRKPNAKYKLNTRALWRWRKDD